MIESDPFFEALLDANNGPVTIRDVTFDPSAVARLDDDAYRTLQLDLLDEVNTRIDAELDSESLNRLASLRDLIPKGRVVPFIGAGLSANAELPTWGGFLAQLAEGRVEAAEVAADLEAGDLEGLAQRIIEAAGMDFLDERLSVFDGVSQIPAIHGLLPRLFRQSVYTTNFDRLIEVAYNEAALDFSIVVYSSQVWQGLAYAYSIGDRPLVKLHGDCRLANTRVLSKSEYDASYANESPLLRDLKYLFSACAILFIGCSLQEDRTMSVALETAQSLGREGPRHYALLPLPADISAKGARERFLNDRHIFPIWYPAEGGDHSLLAEILWHTACLTEDTLA
jgi:SIR2-like protein